MYFTLEPDYAGLHHVLAALTGRSRITGPDHQRRFGVHANSVALSGTIPGRPAHGPILQATSRTFQATSRTRRTGQRTYRTW